MLTFYKKHTGVESKSSVQNQLEIRKNVGKTFLLSCLAKRPMNGWDAATKNDAWNHGIRDEDARLNPKHTFSSWDRSADL